MPVLTGCSCDCAGVRRRGSTVPFWHSITRQCVHAALGVHPLNVNAPFIAFLAGIAQGRAPVKNTAICSSKDRVTQQNHVNSQKFDICALYNDKLRLTVISLINNPEKSLELFQKLNTPPKQVQKKSVVGRIKKKCLPQHTWASC